MEIQIQKVLDIKKKKLEHNVIKLIKEETKEFTVDLMLLSRKIKDSILLVLLYKHIYFQPHLTKEDKDF